ncbi:Hypothetical_protein [Hexamita inflata]|uniref:Hypothetical_protein n=1 Tax=Hexamita inflata TaxID=28002 RepID=A0AA86VTA2_9EUKA|nr:Hypothetical protein HINF_LOCUS64818 [Hexamita inflata]
MLPLDIALLGKTPVVAMSTPYYIVQKRKQQRDAYIQKLFQNELPLIRYEIQQSRPLEQLPVVQQQQKRTNQMKPTQIKNPIFLQNNSCIQQNFKSQTEKVKTVQTHLNKIDNGMFKGYQTIKQIDDLACQLHLKSKQ